ncbi:hypothetical protein J11TS1_15870 [Oceanobacillus sp. J11TS1]|nr:hypothetical protein [Oceanobacillus sp. J11TS1]GIO23006.1 hypothetical protein J11TS1_15870 [Oceanobacillus sp. J11TS1]
MRRGLYSATEFTDVVAFIQRQRQSNSAQKDVNEEIKMLHSVDPELMNTQTESRELDRYLDVLKEGVTG